MESFFLGVLLGVYADIIIVKVFLLVIWVYLLRVSKFKVFPNYIEDFKGTRWIDGGLLFPFKGV